MNKLIGILLLLIFSFQVHSKSWTKLFSENAYFQFSEQKPMILGNKVVYKTETVDGFGLRSYDLTTHNQTNLIPPDVSYELNDVIQLGESVYFLIKRYTAEPYFQLWKTNGDLYETQKVSDIEFRTGYFKPSLVLYGENLFARGDNGSILSINNDEITTHQLQLYEPYLSRMCVFDEQNFIVFDVYNGNKVILVNNGVISNITSQFPEGFFIHSAVTVNNDCYFNYTVFENPQEIKGIMKVTKNGSTTSFQDSNRLQVLYSIFSQNNQLYAFKDDTEERQSTLVKLSNNDLSELKHFKMQGLSFGSYITTKQMLIVNDYVYDTSLSTHYFLDSNLNLIEQNSVTWGTTLPKIQSLKTTDNLIYPGENPSVNFRIKTIDDNLTFINYNPSGFDFTQDISNEFNDTAYFVLNNQETGEKSLYSLDDKPKIGQSLGGVWHSAEKQNQGVMIRPGIRNDGSAYIFVTIYTFKDGKPFWLAGNADYHPGQSSISIDLYDFQGTDFLELIEVPARNDFGTIILTPKDCHTIELTLTNSEINFDFEISRIDNTIFDKYCLEPMSSQ